MIVVVVVISWRTTQRLAADTDCDNTAVGGEKTTKDREKTARTKKIVVVSLSKWNEVVDVVVVVVVVLLVVVVALLLPMNQ
jgi:predicted metal-binding membrane protein